MNQKKERKERIVMNIGLSMRRAFVWKFVGLFNQSIIKAEERSGTNTYVSAPSVHAAASSPFCTPRT